MAGGILGADQRACPECKAVITKNSSACPHCNTKFDAFGYVVSGDRATVVASDVADGQLFRDGTLLIARSGARFPDRCLKTNAPAPRRLHADVYWHHPALYLMIFFPGLLFYAIVALIVRKKASFDFPLSDERLAKRKRDMGIAWGLFALSLCLFFTAGSANMGELALVGVLCLLASPIYWIAVGNVVSPRKIENDYAHLSGACPEFLDTLPQWTGR